MILKLESVCSQNFSLNNVPLTGNSVTLHNNNNDNDNDNDNDNSNNHVTKYQSHFISHMSKGVIVLEMSCPWVTNGEKKKEKITKHGLLHWELKQKFQGCELKQYNIIIDELGI